MNVVALMGFLTRDVEVRYTPSGAAIGTSAIALNRKWRNEAGELQEEVSFIDLVMFGKTAKTAAEYLKKGSPLAIEGRLKQDRWDDKVTGKPRSRVQVIVDRLNFVPRQKNDGPDPAAKPAPMPHVERENAAKDLPSTKELFDDVPF